MQKPWSCDDSMGGNTIVRDAESRQDDRSVEQQTGSADGDRRPRV